MAQQTENNNMTAVEWLMEQLKEYDFADIKDNEYYIIKIPCWVLNEKKEQAKQMEKQQKMNDYKHGQNNGYMYRDGASNIISAEQYYNETYGNP